MADGRAGAFADAAVVIATGFTLREVLRFCGATPAIGALATVATVALCTWLLRRRGRTWAGLGLRRPADWGVTAAWSLGLFGAEFLAQPLVTGPLADALRLPPQDLAAFAALKHNTWLFLIMIIPVGWGAAAFGEEMIFRGFVNRRLTDAFGGTGIATALALVIQSSLFALAHAYLGPRGVMNAGAIAVLAGTVYLANGRSLWPLVIAHGLLDSVGLTVLYLGIPHG